MFSFRIPVWGCGLAIMFTIGSAQAQSDGANRLEKYEATVNAVLHTHRDEEKKFISDVFKLVEKGRVPQKIVDQSLSWVRIHRSKTKHPFVYFERILRFHAKKLDILLPAFDYSIYNRRK